MKKTEERKQEIKYLKKLLETSNVILEGGYGSGKTFISERATKDEYWYGEVDILTFEHRKKPFSGIFTQLPFLHKLFLFLKLLPKIFAKYIFAPYLSLLTLVIPILVEEKVFKDAPLTTGIALSSVAIVTLFLFVIGWLIIGASQIWKRKGFVFGITEINFTKNEQLAFAITWYLKNIFPKNTRFIFETTQSIPQHLSSKLNCKVMFLETQNGSQNVFNNFINHIFTEENFYLQDTFINDLKMAEHNIDKLNLFKFLSARDINNVNNQFLTSFIYWKGEINYFDLVFVYFLKKYAKDVFDIYLKNFEYLIGNVFEDDEKFKLIKISLNKSFKFNNEYAVIIKSRNLFGLDEGPAFLYPRLKKGSFPIDNAHNFKKYINISGSYLSYGKILNAIKINPFEAIDLAIEMGIDWNLINLSALTNDEIYNFLNTLNKDVNKERVLIHKFRFPYPHSNSSLDKIYEAFIYSRANIQEFVENTPNTKDRWIFYTLWVSKRLEEINREGDARYINISEGWDRVNKGKVINYGDFSKGFSNAMQLDYAEKYIPNIKSNVVNSIKNNPLSLAIFCLECDNTDNTDLNDTSLSWNIRDYFSDSLEELLKIIKTLQKITELRIEMKIKGVTYGLKPNDINITNITDIFSGNNLKFKTKENSTNTWDCILPE
ncbi:hypothetical protein [Mycoplasma todarodis]|uniref:hypothetical protein n=1 Tax=Mycoplasma todarodis TaxID=1937191 RepID=UPI003B2A552C